MLLKAPNVELKEASALALFGFSFFAGFCGVAHAVFGSGTAATMGVMGPGFCVAGVLWLFGKFVFDCVVYAHIAELASDCGELLQIFGGIGKVPLNFGN